MAYQPYSTKVDTRTSQLACQLCQNAGEDFTDGWLAIIYVEFEHLGQARAYSETIAMTIV